MFLVSQTSLSFYLTLVIFSQVHDNNVRANKIPHLFCFCPSCYGPSSTKQSLTTIAPQCRCWWFLPTEQWTAKMQKCVILSLLHNLTKPLGSWIAATDTGSPWARLSSVIYFVKFSGVCFCGLLLPMHWSPPSLSTRDHAHILGSCYVSTTV